MKNFFDCKKPRVFLVLKVGCEKAVEGHFARARSDRTRENGFKLK